MCEYPIFKNLTMMFDVSGNFGTDLLSLEVKCSISHHVVVALRERCRMLYFVRLVDVHVN